MKSDLFFKLREENVTMEPFEVLDENDYSAAVANNEANVYRATDRGGVHYFRTDGTNEYTSLDLQFRTYKCIKTIKNIVVITFVAAIICGLIITFM